jgi:hypothetical protein
VAASLVVGMEIARPRREDVSFSGDVRKKAFDERVEFRLHVSVRNMKTQNVLVGDTETRRSERLFFQAEVSQTGVVGISILAVCDGN